MDYLPLKIVRNNKSYFFLWCGNDNALEDRIFTLDHQVPYFDTLVGLHEFTQTIRVEVNRHAVIDEINLDLVLRWIESDDEGFIPSDTLVAWNVLSDFQIENCAWQEFQTESENAAQAHYALSQIAIESELKKSIEPMSLPEKLSAPIKRVLVCGLEAFDATIELKTK